MRVRIRELTIMNGERRKGLRRWGWGWVQVTTSNNTGTETRNVTQNVVKRKMDSKRLERHQTKKTK